MSLDIISHVFESLISIDNLSIQLIKINHSKVTGTKYAARKIEIKDSDLTSFLTGISRLNSTGKKSIREKYNAVRAYDGTAEVQFVYKLFDESPLIQSEYQSLLTGIANPETENDPFNYQSAYLIKGEISSYDSDESRTGVILISCINPVTSLKNKYLFFDNQFKKADDRILNLRNTFDILIVNHTVYFLTMAGETFFHMEHAYKNICVQTVNELIASELFSNPEAFRTVATSKHNPRRFVSYDKNNFEYLKQYDNRKHIADKFQIELTDEGLFDTTTETNTNKIVKFLCNKGMVHPINECPVEVNGTRPWS